MPIGTRHTVKGVLNEGRVYPVLRVDDGGRWRLDVDADVSSHYGRRVAIDGVRDGFDLLAVERMRCEATGETLWPRPGLVSQIVSWAAGLARRGSRLR